jgi:Carboxylesterase family
MEPVVKTVYGKVRGLASDGVASFKGISYAAPPFGPNRMRPPARPGAWDGIPGRHGVRRRSRRDADDRDTRATMTFDLDSALIYDPRPGQRVVWEGIR